MKILVLLFALLGFAATNDGGIDYWKILGKKTNKFGFHKKIQALNGQTIYLAGYYIPMDGKYVLSRYSCKPSLCFYCTNLSYRSTVELDINVRPQIRKNHYTVWKGTLELNDSNYLERPYILKNAKLISKSN